MKIFWIVTCLESYLFLCFRYHARLTQAVAYVLEPSVIDEVLISLHIIMLIVSHVCLFNICKKEKL